VALDFGPTELFQYRQPARPYRLRSWWSARSFGARAFSPAVSPPAPSLGDAAQLLDVDVDELARAVHLVAADRGPRHLVEVVEPFSRGAPAPGAPSTPAGRRCRRCAPAPSPASGAASPPVAQSRPWFWWAPLRPRRAILESGWALLPIAAPPDVGPRDPHGRCRMGHRPAAFDPLAQEQSTLWGQASVTVHPKPPGERVAEQLHTRLGGFIYGWTLSARSMALHLAVRSSSARVSPGIPLPSRPSTTLPPRQSA